MRVYHVVNKRLDEWVDESRMKLDEVQGPRKPDAKTPIKGQGNGATGSRPASPIDHSQSSTPTPTQMRRGPPAKKKKLDDVRGLSLSFRNIVVSLYFNGASSNHVILAALISVLSVIYLLYFRTELKLIHSLVFVVIRHTRYPLTLYILYTEAAVEGRAFRRCQSY